MNAIQILQVLDSVPSYSDIWWVSYDRYRDGIWELPRDCDKPDSHDDNTADDHAGPSVDGGGVALL